jgi:prepilin-type N-terminal cleavage/methylation domain-containing protein
MDGRKMDSVKGRNMRIIKRPDISQSGFTLVETLMALLILSGGLLALATGLTQGMLIMLTSHPHQIAKEKAAEAMENVFTARDAQKIASWSDVQNAGNGGIFSGNPEPLAAPGPDGLVNTADDEVSNIETDRQAGPDDTLFTSDDILVPLDNFQRQIIITEITANLRQIQVIITYTVGQLSRQYQLTAYISPYA